MDDVLSLLEGLGPGMRSSLKLLFHCYSGGLGYLDRVLGLGARCAIGGAVTWARSDELREVAARIPYGVSASGFTDGEWPGDASAKKTSEKIISTMIEYYSAYCERMNSGSDKVLSFIDNSSELYKQVEAITEGTDPHSISSLSFGDIVSEGNSYYSLVRVTDRKSTR